MRRSRARERAREASRLLSKNATAYIWYAERSQRVRCAAYLARCQNNDVSLNFFAAAFTVSRQPTFISVLNRFIAVEKPNCPSSSPTL